MVFTSNGIECSCFFYVFIHCPFIIFVNVYIFLLFVSHQSLCFLVFFKFFTCKNFVGLTCRFQTAQVSYFKRLLWLKFTYSLLIGSIIHFVDLMDSCPNPYHPYVLENHDRCHQYTYEKTKLSLYANLISFLNLSLTYHRKIHTCDFLINLKCSYLQR